MYSAPAKAMTVGPQPHLRRRQPNFYEILQDRDYEDRQSVKEEKARQKAENEARRAQIK